jgi:hypothetical protein
MRQLQTSLSLETDLTVVLEEVGFLKRELHLLVGSESADWATMEALALAATLTVLAVAVARVLLVRLVRALQAAMVEQVPLTPCKRTPHRPMAVAAVAEPIRGRLEPGVPVAVVPGGRTALTLRTELQTRAVVAAAVAIVVRRTSPVLVVAAS